MFRRAENASYVRELSVWGGGIRRGVNYGAYSVKTKKKSISRPSVRTIKTTCGRAIITTREQRRRRRKYSTYSQSIVGDWSDLRNDYGRITNALFRRVRDQTLYNRCAEFFAPFPPARRLPISRVTAPKPIITFLYFRKRPCVGATSGGRVCNNNSDWSESTPVYVYTHTFDGAFTRVKRSR